MARDDGAQMSAHLLLGSIGFSIPDRFVHRSLLGELLSAVGGLGLQRRTPLDHRLRRPNLGLPNGSRRLDVDDHAVVGVDQIIGGVGEEGMPLVRARPLGRRIRSGNELRGDGRGRAERRIVERGEIFARREPRSP